MDIVNANINSLLDKAEDPEKMIKLMMQEMEDTLIELKSSCAAKIASKTKLDRKRDELDNLAKRWMSRAELALGKGREDLAREALMEKRRALERNRPHRRRCLRYDEMIKKSKEDIGKLEDKLQSLRQKHQTIIERAARPGRSSRRMIPSGRRAMPRHSPGSSTMEQAGRQDGSGCKHEQAEG
jgi:phage shock protein A